MNKMMTAIAAFGLLSTTALADDHMASNGQATNVYFGDTHLHTSYSFDAFLNGNHTATPDVAYRWAKGEPVIHPFHKGRVQIDRPLDFLVVSDHAEYMGVMRHIYNDGELPEIGIIDSIQRWLAIRFMKQAVDSGGGREAFVSFLPEPSATPGGDPVAETNNGVPSTAFGPVEGVEQSAWDDIADAADKHNNPGKFSAIIGWEWSSIPTGANLHRIVMSSSSGEDAKQYLPYGSDQSQYPQDLWNWMDQTEKEAGVEFISIPHNSNISKGYMFGATTLKGEAITPDYANWRMRWEPVVETTQIKGDSETHPGLSPDDPFADFETYGFYIQKTASEYKADKADYIRSALKRGLEIEEEIGANPYKFGLIGSTDAHTSMASADEYNFHGKLAQDSIPENKFRAFNDNSGPTGWNMGASGLAAAWATENTREAIFAAFKRREVYATTGPRMSLRVFGGFDYDADDADDRDFADIGYKGGVPMGGDLIRQKGNDPVQLLIRAVKDPTGANLDRVQVVKGWVDANGEAQEKVFNVAWSEGRSLDAEGKLPPVGNTVDMKTGKTANSIGAVELSTLWTDPEFDANQRAFYYVRVLQIPTARHSLLDFVALGWDEYPDGRVPPRVLQDRAYSSPIWYTP